MIDTIDLSSYHLLIATPSAAGKPESDYSMSLDHTKQLIKQYGGKVDSFSTKYVSAIHYARAKLFSFFLRHKSATHMIMIDDDQDWIPQDIIWMLLLNRDFLSAVSCKKVYPPEFAYNMIDENGKKAVLYHELETNIAEIPFVGGAFVMISRNCAEKIAFAYPELQYDNPDGEVEYAVFDPIIINRRRLEDDYSFCYRWRKIGGKVEVKMDINLGHTGSHRFSGSLYEFFLKHQPNFMCENHG